MNSFVEASNTRPPHPRNEPVRDYAPNSPERSAIKAALEQMSNQRVELPLIINGGERQTGRRETVVMPHRRDHVLGEAHLASEAEVRAAINAAVSAWKGWSNWPWTERAAVFLKAAELVSGPWRDRLNAATMLGQSKTIHQAEIDSAAELIDFWRFNVEFMRRLYEDQPISAPGVWNRSDYRPLEGFVLAITPFNFTAIAGNLPTAPALMGNTVVWKPAATAKYSAHLIMQILQEAGLPDGVINLVYGDGAEIAGIALADERLAGVHFTGSTQVFNDIFRKVGASIDQYRNYPRLVGETGGKNFILAHQSTDVAALATAIIRGGYEYQGQKCSAASRIFVPTSLWATLKTILCDEIATIRVGDVADFTNFMGAVIDEKAWRKHMRVFEEVRSSNAKILRGGEGDNRIGYFVAPTLIETDDLESRLLREEFFGPIVTAYVYRDSEFDSILKKIDRSGAYGLTGAIFSRDRRIINCALGELRSAAGNFYINDKPTGAIVGQQPFGGARMSGTNDKAGSMWNLIRWTSPRSIKEAFVPPRDYRYPFLTSNSEDGLRV
ncbi:L-glutamate gamma-semialdehyde dehydrogenase [Bradyrhizobium zhanjiangense]|uniref:L-glutamate gamma-semialdehyde dehydrogenase n=1 Tax=Bradyrhizobium zhanjiangense TaxID=1325107 RepID=A0ABY0D8V0_9BRAD|nr:L-glutamate gamma-semialdehyde dehydrogenase [Bradyrhizobium zhanjiangense]RXG85834.1 L-glutamate gamma-semialdehyde dehydrogenase [Bradyrhizobium zhanjiangense]